jgi:putative glutamine amidotransferase
MMPIIGISTYLGPAHWGHWERVAAVTPQSYVEAVVAAGAMAVLLPPNGVTYNPGLVHARSGEAEAVEAGPGDAESIEVEAVKAEAVKAGPGGAEPGGTEPVGIEEAVNAIDALVLSGGADIDPARYGELPQPRTATTPHRDAWEFALLHAALERGLPVLAICRGMQLLNVVYGGTLVQHLPDVVGHDGHRPELGVFGRIYVRTDPASQLAGILGPEVTVPCHHHQSVCRLGNGLAPSGWASDGTVEAIELVGHKFVIGVQWHPEEDRLDRRLFKALVHAIPKT